MELLEIQIRLGKSLDMRGALPSGNTNRLSQTSISKVQSKLIRNERTRAS
jgi:hypothetical protein